MKFIIPIFIALVAISCKSVEVIEYKYKSTTMLGSRTITITKDSVVAFFMGRGESTYKSRATTAEEWNQLELSIKGIEVKELASLEAPTNRRATDAAPYGTVYLSSKDSTYTSQSFDGFNSHTSLLPLMAIMKKISVESFR